MAENVQEQLLGYLLDALEDDERQQIQDDLSKDPQLRQQLETLRVVLAPMELSREPIDPPRGLAHRTCGYVAARIAASKPKRDSRPVPAGRLHAMRPDVRLDGVASQFSWLDVMAVAGILMAASLLLFPAIHSSRVQSRITHCAGNLHSLYQGLAQYSETFAGYLPSAPPTDRLGVGGGFAVLLQSTGGLENPRQLICPDSPMSEVAEFSVPTLEQMVLVSEGKELERVQASLGGSYSMSLGYEQDHCFQGLRNRGRDHFALVSDVPDPGAADFRSLNHAGGRNVLFGGGNVRFMVLPVATVGTDHFFLNAAGRIGLGLNPDDSVIPPAGRLPIVYTSNR